MRKYGDGVVDQGNNGERADRREATEILAKLRRSEPRLEFLGLYDNMGLRTNNVKYHRPKVARSAQRK